MKKIVITLVLSLCLVVLVACASNEDTGYTGTYVGYSWKGENNGVLFDDATEYVITTLTLDKDGVILDAEVDFKILKDGVWSSRLNGNTAVAIDYSVTPTAAVLGTTPSNGTSMFTITGSNMMSFYAVGVNADGIVALTFVDPMTRYRFEVKLDSTFDYTQPVSTLTIGSGLLVPTTQTAGGALTKPASWDSLAAKTFFDISYYSHVVTDSGIFAGVTKDSTVKLLLEKLGVSFIDDKPQEQVVSIGYFGLGGWAGNYAAIASFLIGKNATELLSLVDWTNPDYLESINDDNEFGVDVPAGSTVTVQDSFDTIAGATVRMSRESESYQKALVEAGILTLEDVIIGRF